MARRCVDLLLKGLFRHNVAIDVGSFDAVDHWLELIQQSNGSNGLTLILANKCDLKEKRVVTEEAGIAKAKKHGCRHFQMSSFDLNETKEVRL